MDSELRAKLDTWSGTDLSKPWGWFEPIKLINNNVGSISSSSLSAERDLPEVKKLRNIQPMAATPAKIANGTNCSKSISAKNIVAIPCCYTLMLTILRMTRAPRIWSKISTPSIWVPMGSVKRTSM